ncbi:MAG: ATP-binding cassette domain-containing protein [Desulfovibrio sp.]|nr:ATP-binding cassette domain-containing protein [Desulfovibrio sp.]
MAAFDITLVHLNASYGEHVVLKDLNCTLPEGSISVILGGSGCGKSTLLRHIIGLKKPSHGQILINGQDLFALAKRDFRRLRRQMGVLFQDGALLGAMTLAENVALPLTEHLNLPKAMLLAEAKRVLELVGLGSETELYPHQLSGGMRKRAGLARAMITNPRILLCDEPTSGLDPITAARMDDLLLFLHHKFPAMTIVCVSHDLASLTKIADYVLVLKDGTSIFAGTVAELNKATDPYLKQFLAREGGESANVYEKSMEPRVNAALQKWLTT